MKLRVLLSVVVFSVFLSAGSAQMALYRYLGASPLGFLREVAAGGDLDGDGIPDFLLAEVFAAVSGTNDVGRISAYSGRTGVLLYSIDGVPGLNHKFGHELDFIGDINGDGLTDFITSDPFASFAGVESGRVTVHSGANGAVLFTFDGNPDLDFDGSGDFLGFAVSGAGDANNDGIPDFVYGRPGNYIAGGICSSANDAGEVIVRSGLDGSIIFNVTGLPNCQTLGFSLDGVGDINGDGFDDIVIGHDNGGAGQVLVVGGVPPAFIHVVNGPTSTSFFGNRVFGAGDVDGDGTPDFAAFSFAFDATLSALPGELTILSGVDASVIHHLVGDSNLDRFGAGFEPVPDLDGDGKDEFLLGAWGADPNGGSSGTLELYNGDDATVIRGWAGFGSGSGLGDHGTFAPLGDVNFDGVLDVVMSQSTPSSFVGFVGVFSVEDLALNLTGHETSIANGSSTIFTMAAPVSEAGNAYYLLGSISGFSPGIDLGNGLNLPLNPDVFFNFTLDFSNSPLLGSFGFLSGSAYASASWTIPANGVPASLAGISTYWAFVTYDSAMSQYSFTSNHAIHTLIP